MSNAYILQNTHIINKQNIHNIK